MARTVKEHGERRREIVSTAEHLFYQQGYTQTSVRDIIDAVGIAKGTFYHYFDSKVDLLDELVEHIMVQSVALLKPVVADETLDALTKFSRFFERVGNWKVARKEFVLDMMRVLYRDENVLLRSKMIRRSTDEIMAPMLCTIIQQGIDEGVFDVAHPRDSAEVVARIGLAYSESFAYALLETDERSALLPSMERKTDAYERGIERVLGAPAGSLSIVPRDQLREWLA